MNAAQLPVGVVLAGGRSSRMGEEKALIELAGVPLLRRAVDRLSGQVSSLVLSANGDAARFDRYELPVVKDTIDGFKGPLAGLLAGMMWTIEHHPGVSHIVSTASDTPFFPLDLVSALGSAIGQDDSMIAVPQTLERLHPAFGLWPVSLAPALEETLLSGQFRVHQWLHANRFVPVEFSPEGGRDEGLDPFFNINDPADLQVAMRWINNKGIGSEM